MLLDPVRIVGIVDVGRGDVQMVIAAAALHDEALAVKIDRFAFTANNITYGAFGVATA